MKREIMSLFTTEGGNKKLNLNKVFYLEALVTDASDVNVEISKKPGFYYHVELRANPINGHECGVRYTINAREYEDIVNQIADGIKYVMNDITTRMLSDFKNGYIRG